MNGLAGQRGPERVVILDAEIDSRRVDVRIRGERIDEIGSLRPEPGEAVVRAAGGALLPGLHDHHLHLLSMAAAADSTRCGPPEVGDVEALARAVRGTPGRWVRGIGYHESVAGILDRHALDRITADRPVRVQHRGGALWMLNTAALRELRLLDEFDDGRLWRRDDMLRERLGDRDAPDLAAVGRRLAAFGITGVTDATPNLSSSAIELLTGAGLPQRLHLLGAPADARLPRGVTLGPHKILPPDHEPPDWDRLRAEIDRAHRGGRPVAIHAVTRESLVVALAVLREVGTLPGDRMEHAAIVGDDLLPLLAEVNPIVVTQPAFVVEREREYRRDITESDHHELYRYAGLLSAAIAVAPSSDAPFGTPDPWRIMKAASTRDLVPAERVAPHRVLNGMLAPLDDPGGPPRRLAPGAPADLCLLRTTLAEALARPEASVVATAVCRGVVQDREMLS